MNVFGIKGSAPKQAQEFSETLAFGRDLYKFYQSRGDAVLVGANEIVTALDGPEKVVMYDDLTVGDGTTATTLTASQRCKGLAVIVRGNLTVRNNASIKMTARGARVDRNDDPRFPFIDLLIPNRISLYSEVMSRRAALELIAKRGLAPWDRGFWDSDGGILGLSCGIVEAGIVTLVSVAGCGAKANGVSGANGNTGNAGASGAPGSGGSGGAIPNLTGSCSGSANPYSGGSASGGTQGSAASQCGYSAIYSATGGRAGVTRSDIGIEDTITVSNNGGGGGSGNPGGKRGPYASDTDGESGTGGRLIIICYGNVTVEAGGKIESNGSKGGNGTSGTSPGGGGSGGGTIIIITPAGGFINLGTVQCAGGGAGGGYYSGGAGGAGSVVTKTFAQMGWE